jgi:hypothetical protein
MALIRVLAGLFTLAGPFGPPIQLLLALEIRARTRVVLRTRV